MIVTMMILIMMITLRLRLSWKVVTAAPARPRVRAEGWRGGRARDCPPSVLEREASGKVPEVRPGTAGCELGMEGDGGKGGRISDHPHRPVPLPLIQPTSPLARRFLLMRSRRADAVTLP